MKKATLDFKIGYELQQIRIHEKNIKKFKEEFIDSKTNEELVAELSEELGVELTIVCENPFEIESEDGDKATGLFASLLLEQFKELKQWNIKD